MQRVARDLIIEARGVVKTYGAGGARVRALPGVDLEVRAGELVALLGPGGSGKSALLRCLAGIDPIDGGVVRLAGRRLEARQVRAQALPPGGPLGFIFQHGNLLPLLFCVENVELPLLRAGVPAGESRQRALAALAWVGLPDVAWAQPHELVEGQGRRVALARSIAPAPAIIWADEPSGDLDPLAATALVDLLVRRNREHGQTVLLATRSPEVAARADRVIILPPSRLLANPLPAPVFLPPIRVAAERSGVLPLVV